MATFAFVSFILLYFTENTAKYYRNKVISWASPAAQFPKQQQAWLPLQVCFLLI
jgi:hypothetical protein